MHQRCDGIIQCPNERDEASCSILSPSLESLTVLFLHLIETVFSINSDLNFGRRSRLFTAVDMSCTTLIANGSLCAALPALASLISLAASARK